MKKISTDSIYFYKWIFPAFWFGFLAYFILFSIINSEEIDIIFIAVPGFMFIFGFIFFKQFIWDIVDEAWDEGEFIRVRKGRIEERIPLGNIINISYTIFNPPRATLTLRTPNSLGKEITFSPVQPISVFNLFRKNPVIHDLIERVDNTRKS